MAGNPDAIALLKADHREVEDLFEKVEKAKGHATKKSLAERICMDLTLHTMLEEDIFYPACEGAVEEDLLRERDRLHQGRRGPSEDRRTKHTGLSVALSPALRGHITRDVRLVIDQAWRDSTMP
jgi:hemerythrin superfamily protein